MPLYMTVHLLGTNPLHLNLLQSTLLSAGWSADALHVQPSGQALEAALAQAPQGLVVLDLGADEEPPALRWVADITRRWPTVPVMLLCANRSEALLLQAMRSGVREVLDSPPEPQELLQAVQRLGVPVLDPAPVVAEPVHHGQVLALVGSKGGCGNTLLAANLAWLLATEFERGCTLVDLDLLYGDASFYVGGGQARHSLSELMRQGQRLDGQLLRSSLHRVHARLQLLAAPALPELEPPPAQGLARVLELLRQQEAVTVLDVPHHLNPISLQALRLADTVLVVLRNRVPDVRNAQRLMRLLREQGIPAERLRPVLNRHQESGGLDRAAIEQALAPGLAQAIADDPQALQGCVHLGLPLHEHAPGSPVLHDLRTLAASVLQLPAPRRRGWLSRWIAPIR